MIQAIQTKLPNAKALSGATVADENVLDVESLLEGQDFANELMASLEGDLEVRPVIVAPEQMIDGPSSLINNLPQNGHSETVGPKVFDPSVTKSVEEFIRPKTTGIEVPPKSNDELLKVVNPELTSNRSSVSNIVKTEFSPELANESLPQKTVISNNDVRIKFMDLPQVEGESPQLLNVDDFIAQKNIVTKKPVSTLNAYGAKAPSRNEAAILGGLGLYSTQMVGEKKSTENSENPNSTMNSQQFILNMMSEQGQSPKVSESQIPTKVFDISQIKSDNADQVMNQITDYIVQAKVAKEPTVNMRVNHDELGMIDITVSKTHAPGIAQESVAINIGTHSADGKNFFQQNSKDLFAHLTTAGISVSDLKVETPSQTAKNDFDMSHQNRQGSGSERQFGSEQNQRRHESDRRHELWNLLRDKEVA